MAADDPMRPSQEEGIRSHILFTLIERANGKHWKSPFEMKIVLANKEHDAPVPKEYVMPLARDIARAIEFFHGAAVSLNLDTMEAKPVRGEAAAYVFFDGYVLQIGSIGYQG